MLLVRLLSGHMINGPDCYLGLDFAGKLIVLLSFGYLFLDNEKTACYGF